MGPGGDGGLSVGGNPTFAGKGFGGGGFGIMDIGGAFTGAMMSSNPNFTHNLYGLPATDRKTGAPINYGAIFGNKGSTPGVGHDFSDTTGEINSVPSVETWAKSREGVPSFVTNSLEMQMGMDPSSFLDPTTPTPFQPETGIFGGTLGPKLKNAIPAGLREFLGNVAKIHPATMNAVLMGKLVKGWQSADDKGKFMRNVMKGLAMSKFMGSKGLGLDSMQKALVGTGMNVAQGKQNMAQGIGNFATDAGINQLMRNVLPKAYEAQGMNGVYAAIAAIKMLGQRAKEGVSSLGGPGGGG